MELKCETHSRNDAIVVCHHCGRPLCNLIKLPYKSITGRALTKDQVCGYSIIDPTFAVKAGQAGVEASHCESCLQLYHNEFSPYLGQLKANL